MTSRSDPASVNPGGSQEPGKPDEQTVWLDDRSRHHCYLRIGPTSNLATINQSADSPLALALKVAAQKWADECIASANGNDLKGETK